MIITTTSSIEGKRIIEYRGIVFGEVITGVNVVKDIAAGFRDFFGGRSGTYENELVKARDGAMMELQEKAREVNANAVVGVKVDYETLGQGGMLMVTVSGTAVYYE